MWCLKCDPKMKCKSFQ